MPWMGRIGEIVEVRRRRGELHVEWRIPRFLELPGVDLDYYRSPRFDFHVTRWHLEVYPDWGSSGRVSPLTSIIEGLYCGGQWVSLSLRREFDGGSSARTVTVSVGLRGSGGGVEKRTEEEERKFEKDGSFFYDLCTRSELVEQKERLMEGGTLTVVCQMRVPDTAAAGASSSPDVPIRTDTQTREPNALACKCQSLDKQGQQSSDECDVCCEAPIDCALNPCGHMCWCYNCARRFLEADSPRCPMCRTSITNILKLYRK